MPLTPVPRAPSADWRAFGPFALDLPASAWLAAYGGALLALLVLDGLWLGWIASGWYRSGIGHLMAETPRWGAAAAFYLVYPVGVLVFTLGAGGPGGAPAPGGLARAVAAGAAFGFFCYATYDLSNLATLKAWPWPLTVLDIAWGTALSGVVAGVARLAVDAAMRQSPAG